MPLPELSPSQQAAIAHVNDQALARRDDARALQAHVARMCDLAPEALPNLLAKIRNSARVGLHFHPDRPAADGRTVAEALLEDGVYRSQFETQISNGGVTAFKGGLRDSCEERLFGGAYHDDAAVTHDRPKYGSLDLLGHAEGPSPRFGSCYLLLAAHVSQRCTFTYQDSHGDPKEKGTLQEFDDIFSALLTDVFSHDCALGERDLSVAGLLEAIENVLRDPIRRTSHTPARNLNQYIEAQVHGRVLLKSDADALVLDPAFRGTTTGAQLTELCEKYELALLWHHGFELSAERVPRDFRGPTMPSLAKRVAPSGTLSASKIGLAVQQLHQSPDTWSDRGTLAEVLQELKLLWHVLVRYGDPAPNQSA